MAGEADDTTEDRETSGGSVEIDLDDDSSGDDDGGDDESEGAPERPLTRREKKQSRWREHTQRAEEAERRARDAEARAAAFEAMMRNQPQAQPQAPAPAGPSPIDQELDTTVREQNLLVKEFDLLPVAEKGARLSEYQEKNRKLEEKRFELTVKKFSGNQVDPQQQEARVRREVLQTMIQTNYPDVCADERAIRWAHVQHQLLRAEGAPDDLGTLQRAMEMTRQRFSGRQPQRPPPTQHERNQLTGTPRSSGQGGRPSKVVLTKQDQRMARAAFAHLKDEQKMYRAYAAQKAQMGDDD